MAKKGLLVLVLAAIIATGTVFADHPDGTGIGVVAGYSFGAATGSGSTGDLGLGLSLKFAGLPVFWTVKVAINPYAFGIGLAGDFYFIDSLIVPDIGLSWFLGAGAFVDWVTAPIIEFNYIDFGVRVPVGVSWLIVPEWEVFFDVTPSFGLGLASIAGLGSGAAFFWSIPLELGVRFWF